MSASVVFKGNAGNHMFQYFTAIAFCVKNNINMKTRPTKKMLQSVLINEDIFCLNKSNKKTTTKKKLTFRNFNANNEISFVGEHVEYVFKDFFQNAEYLNNHYDILIKYVIPISYDCNSYLLNYKPIQTTDVLFVLRLGDFIHQGKNSEIVHPQYFLDILDKYSFDSIYFIIHPIKDEYITKYLNYFGDYKKKIILFDNRNELIDFNIVSHFKNIAITNSTFNWWSCFLDKQLQDKTLFTPKKIGYCGIGDKFKCHGAHIQNLQNIRNISIPIDHEFINLKI